MNDGVKISVVIPVFNRANLIGDCILNIKEKIRDDIEILICDDHSTDELKDKVKELQVKYGRIRFICAKDGEKGANVARRNGVFAAKGKYIVFLDSDDYLCENSISCREKILDTHESVAMVYGDSISSNNYIMKHDNLNGVDQRKYMLNELSLCNFSVMMGRTEILRKIPWGELNYPAWQDDAIVAEIIMNGYKIYHCGSVVSRMFLSNDSISRSMEKKNLGCRKMVERYKWEIIFEASIFRYFLWKLRIMYSSLIIRIDKEEKKLKKYYMIIFKEILGKVLNRYFLHIWG